MMTSRVGLAGYVVSKSCVCATKREGLRDVELSLYISYKNAVVFHTSVTCICGWGVGNVRTAPRGICVIGSLAPGWRHSPHKYTGICFILLCFQYYIQLWALLCVLGIVFYSN